MLYHEKNTSVTIDPFLTIFLIYNKYNKMARKNNVFIDRSNFRKIKKKLKEFVTIEKILKKRKCSRLFDDSWMKFYGNLRKILKIVLVTVGKLLRSFFFKFEEILEILCTNCIKIFAQIS